MQGKIGLEEHFSGQETVGDSEEYFPAEEWDLARRRLLDFGDLRLRQMDQAGIETMILSLNAPACQRIVDPRQAIDVARRANDLLAEQVERRKDRFLGFAALPMQDPDAAATEARRCMDDLGFVGALVNGFSQVDDPETVVYLDDPRYEGFWAEFARLDRPFYLHPRNPIESWSRVYQGQPWLLGPAWAFGIETANHMVRLIGSGLFDKHPDLQAIVGHLGEGLPFSIWRLDHWVTRMPKGITIQRPFSHYLLNNFYLTTSGNFRTQALLNAMSEIGVDRVLFSTDYPFEETVAAAQWFDSASISDNDRTKIGRTNAEGLFRLAR